MNNNDSYVFTQDIQHFLTIQFFFEEELLNLNKAGKYSRELLPLLESDASCQWKITWPRNSNTSTKKIQNQDKRGLRGKIVPRKEKDRDGRNIVEEVPHFLAQHPNPHHHH